MKESVKFFEAMRDFAEAMLKAEHESTCDCEKAESEKKETKKETKKEETKVENAEKSYEDMNTKELYKLCCDRGISSKVKSRKKVDLIEALKAYDNGDFNEDEPQEEETDDWEEEDEEETKDPYEGKTAKELYKMCCDRGIKCKTKQKPEAYAKLLKKDDEKQAETDTEDDDDDWEF